MSDTDSMDSMDEYIVYDPDGCDSDDGSPNMMPPPLYEVPGILPLATGSMPQTVDITRPSSAQPLAMSSVVTPAALTDAIIRVHATLATPALAAPTIKHPLSTLSTDTHAPTSHPTTALVHATVATVTSAAYLPATTVVNFRTSASQSVVSAGINASNVDAHDHTEAAAVHAVANDDIIEEDADESSDDEDDDGRLEPGLAYQMTASAHLGHQMLYSDRQIYRLKGNRVSKKRYACRIRTCRAALYLKNGVLTKAPRFVEHNHTEQQAVAKKLGFQDGFKKKCKEGEVNPSRLFDRLLEA